MMKLYFNSFSRATRVRWILEELGMPYELVTVDFSKGEHKHPDYMRVHPLGLVPAIEDNGFKMFESAALVMHLADQHPEKGLAPAVGTKERGEYYQWILFAMTEAEPPLVRILEHTRLLPEDQRQPAVIEQASKRFKTAINVVQNRLQGRDYLFSNTFTAADVVMGGVVNFANFLGQLGDHPGLQAYLKRLKERPAARKSFPE
jgi:glutathione S-transferase